MAITNPRCGASHHYCHYVCRAIQQNQGDWEKLHVISKLQLESEAYNGDAFWLWNMREQWAFVHDLQIQEVREKNKTK